MAQEHQWPFDALKEALVTVSVPGYLDFNREFMLKIDASLQRLRVVFSQHDENSKLHVIAYKGQSLQWSEWTLAYVRESKLGASQIWWLSELVLFDFTICYWTGWSYRPTSAFNRCPHNEDLPVRSN